MSGRIGIDFGTSNSVVAVWDPATGRAESVRLPELGVVKTFANTMMHVTPSLIHYGSGGTTWIGGQVQQQQLYEDPATFRWMKRYIGDRVAIPKQLPDGRTLSPVQAGRDFLARVVQDAAVEIGGGLDEEVAFSVPVEAFEHYEKWIRDVAETSGVTRFRLIDEASAAALGHGAAIQPGDVYLVFDFGGGTLDVSVVRIEEDDAKTAGRRCRVLGKQGANVGGSVIDGWLYQEVLRRNTRHHSDEDVRRMSAELIVRCEEAKERLSTLETADVQAQDPKTGRLISTELKRTELEDLLDEHDLFARVERTINAALTRAREKGFDEDSVKQVLLVGGSSLIPSIQKTVRRKFGSERVSTSRPLDAVAAGAAAFVSGVDFFDHIQHDYAIQHLNPRTNTYEYRTLVPQGTAYPSKAAVADFTVKASYDGQRELGVAIYEISEPSSRDTDQPVELIFDHTGAARVVEVEAHERHTRSHFWMNEDAPTFLPADPPGRKGQPRFHVSFFVDENKRLLITARDLVSNRWIYERAPVVKLT